MRKNLLVLLLIVLFAGQSCVQKSSSPSKDHNNWYSKELVKVKNGSMIPRWANEAKKYGAPVPEWHVVTEFYADGFWSMADASDFFVHPHPDGHLMSAAKCHDGREGQILAQKHYEKRLKEIDKFEDKDFGCDPVNNRMANQKRIKVVLYHLDRFQVMNYPLPN